MCSHAALPYSLLWVHYAYTVCCANTGICLGNDRIFFSMLEQFVTPWLNFQKMTPLGRMELMVLYYLTAHDMVTVSALLIAKAAYTQLLSGLVLSSA